MIGTAERESPTVPGRAFLWIAGVLFALGGVLRILGAWWYRNGDNPDFGVVGLMAKHMAEGRDFPVFFYGQAYMGSFEPAVSALLCRLFGCSGFMVCLGAAVLGILLLPVVYAWARDAGGRTAGLAALTFCLIGPEGYFHYQGSPRGGYPTTLLLGALILWLTARVIVRERAGGKVRWPWFLLLGGLAGLGVWSDLLIVPALLCAGLLAAVFLRQRLFSWRAACALPGFAAGSLPFWIWNTRHGWASFGLARSVGSLGQTFRAGQELFWQARLMEMLRLDTVPEIWRLVVLALYAVLAGVALWALKRPPGNRAGRMYLLSAVWFVPVFALVFSVSSFSAARTSRYLLPLVPVLAVLAGTATAALSRVLPAGTAWLPLLVLIGWQAWALPAHPARAAKYEIHSQRAAALRDFLRSNGPAAVYTPYLCHGLNFKLGEEFVFSDVKGERYRPYAAAAETADEVGVLNNYGGISEFVRTVGAGVECTSFGLFWLYHDLAPPPTDVQEVPVEAWHSAASGSGRDMLETLTDRSLDTFLRCERAPGEPEPIRIRLHEPTRVSGVQVICRSDTYPRSWSVAGQTGPESEQETLLASTPVSYYFFSGPRVYWDGSHYRLECRFSPRSLQSVEISFEREAAHEEFRVAEVRLLTPGPATAPQPDALPDLLKLLKRRGIRRLYSDRWVANAVHTATRGAILTAREPAVFSDAAPDDPGWVTLDPHTALLVAEPALAGARFCLDERRIDMRETAVGPWVLLDFGPGQWRPEYASPPGLYCFGYTCLLGGRKQWASTLAQRAKRIAAEENDLTRAVTWMREAVAAYPNHRPGIQKLAAWLRESGNEEEARVWEEQASAMWTPSVRAEAEFAGGARLIGVFLDPAAVRPGQTFSLRCYWTCPPEVQTELLAAFVHFVGQEGMFQDDHVLLQDAEVGFQPFPEVFVEERSVAVPPGTPPGDYRMRIGLYSRMGTGKRVRVRTGLEQHRRAVWLPVTVRVVGDGDRSSVMRGE